METPRVGVVGVGVVGVGAGVGVVGVVVGSGSLVVGVGVNTHARTYAQYNLVAPHELSRWGREGGIPPMLCRHRLTRRGRARAVPNVMCTLRLACTQAHPCSTLTSSSPRESCTIQYTHMHSMHTNAVH